MKVRTGQAPAKLSRQQFGERFRARFSDPAYGAAESELKKIEGIAWDAYHEGRKAPLTREAGPEFADPHYRLSLDWLDTRARLKKAEIRHNKSGGPARILLIIGSARNDGSCPGEESKTFRLVELARACLEKEEKCEVDVLDLSLLTSEYGREIHPCKACVSTAMPLCHWPCSCYPNHGLGQVNDWMAEIYERWTLAHGVLIVTPVYWYQSPSPLKLMIDRLVCADGGNPDPSTTQGKDAVAAKKIELAGWNYPQHLAGRAFGVIVHGDAAGAESVRRGLSDWLESMGLVDAGAQARLDRYIGYYQPYATSHDDLDKDRALHEEVGNAARAVACAVRELRAGVSLSPDRGLSRPRPK